MNRDHPSSGDKTIIAAMEENIIDLFWHFCQWPDITNYRSDWYWQGVSQQPNPFFNPVTRARMTDDEVDEGITAAINRCRNQGVSMMWLRLPSDEPPDLGIALKRHGVRRHFTDPGMVVDQKMYQSPTGPLPAVSIQRVADNAILEQWIRILVAGFEFPADASRPLLQMYRSLGMGKRQPTEQYIARWQGELVTVGTIHFTGRTAGIYNVTTLPSARRQGIGSSLVDHLLQRAWQRGCDFVCLQSSQPGFNMYQKLGFRTVCDVHFHFWLNEAAQE